MVENSCDCADWKKYTPILEGSISLAWTHGMWPEDFKPFIYCPYCSKKLLVKK